MTTDNQLSRIPVITSAILRSQPLTFHSKKLSDLNYLRFLAQKLGETIEIKNDIGEAQVRIYRDAGQRFPTELLRGGNGSNQYQQKEQTVRIVCLADLGFNSRVADICRKIAALPDCLFEDLILGIRTSEHLTHESITANRFFKYGRIHIARSNGIDIDNHGVINNTNVEFGVFSAGYNLGKRAMHYDSVEDAYDHWKAQERNSSDE